MHAGHNRPGKSTAGGSTLRDGLTVPRSHLVSRTDIHCDARQRAHLGVRETSIQAREVLVHPRRPPNNFKVDACLACYPN